MHGPETFDGTSRDKGSPNRPTPSRSPIPKRNHWFMLIFSAVLFMSFVACPPTGFRWRAPLSSLSLSLFRPHPIRNRNPMPDVCVPVCELFPIGWTYAQCHAYLRCWLTDLYGWSLLMHWSPYFCRLIDWAGIGIGIRISESVTITIDPWHMRHFSVSGLGVISRPRMTYFVSII